MAGDIPLFVGLILLIISAIFITNIVFLWISYRRTFQSNRALRLSRLNVLLVTIAAISSLFWAMTIAGLVIMGLPIIMLIVSILAMVRISNRTEKI